MCTFLKFQFLQRMELYFFNLPTGCAVLRLSFQIPEMNPGVIQIQSFQVFVPCRNML